jgi:hypothetical protein
MRYSANTYAKIDTIVLTANLLGTLSGEWQGAPVLARRRLGRGIILLLLAIAGLGYSNSIK